MHAQIQAYVSGQEDQQTYKMFFNKFIKYVDF